EAAGRRLCALLQAWLGAVRVGQAHRNHGPLAFARTDLQPAAMQFRQRTRDGEAEPRAGMALGELVLHLFERIAETLEGIARNAATGIADGDQRAVAGAAGAHMDAV